jgi:predicted outer membrane protein
VSVAGLGTGRKRRVWRVGGLRIRRPGFRQFLTIGACLVLVAATFYAILRPPVTPADGETSGGRVETRWGPLDDGDRVLLVKVRQAGLWEMPTGQQAQQRAKSEKVKDIGRRIAAEHSVLDDDVRGVASQLGVVLPSAPNADQQSWMAELTGKSGDDYDRTFVYRLRAAHGKVFGVIAQIRAATRNSVIRSFAERAMTFVLRHMTYLESTGLVDYSALR